MKPLTLVLAVSLALVPPATSARAADRPTSGKAVPAYEPVDRAIAGFMDLVGAQAATAVVVVDGATVYSRGFGWRDEHRKEPTRPDDLFRIASVSKPVTAVLLKDLIRAKKLSADTKVFPYLGLEPPAGATVDPRLAEVTVRHLAQHAGGWDRATGGDPMFKVREVTKALDLKRPAEPVDVVRYMLGQPLQFAPGEKTVYSNFGYCVLGRVIERAAGKPYGEALRQQICDPLGIHDLKVGRTRAADRDPREVWYPVADGMFSLDVMDAHGGLIASAPALGRFLQAYWISSEPRKAKGQDWSFFGSLPGTTAMVVQRADGIDVAVLLNGRRDGSFAEDNEALEKSVTGAIDAALSKPQRAR